MTPFGIDHTELDHIGSHIERFAGQDGRDGQDGRKGRAVRVLITGPARGAGVSALAWALAQRAVLEGKRVLFLDLDPLMPFTQRVLALGLAREPVAAGQAITRPWRVPGRDLEIACVTTAWSRLSSRGAASDQLAAELDRLSDSHDLIIADAAPIAARRSTGALDGCAMGPHFDLTFVAVQAGATTSEKLRTALARHAEMGGNIAGIMLNERDFERPLEGLLRRARLVAARWPWTVRLLGLRPRTGF